MAAVRAAPDISKYTISNKQYGIRFTKVIRRRHYQNGIFLMLFLNQWQETIIHTVFFFSIISISFKVLINTPEITLTLFG